MDMELDVDLINTVIYLTVPIQVSLATTTMDAVKEANEILKCRVIDGNMATRKSTPASPCYVRW